MDGTTLYFNRSWQCTTRPHGYSRFGWCVGPSRVCEGILLVAARIRDGEGGEPTAYGCSTYLLHDTGQPTAHPAAICLCETITRPVRMTANYHHCKFPATKGRKKSDKERESLFCCGVQAFWVFPLQTGLLQCVPPGMLIGRKSCPLDGLWIGNVRG